MIDFAGYSYAEHKASIVCSHVVSGAAVLLFVHDEDGDIQFMCGQPAHGVDDAQLVGLTHLVEHIGSMPDIPVVEPGYAAERTAAGAPWSIIPLGN